MASMTNDLLESNDDYVPPVKLKKAANEDDHNDLYCFECHDEGDVICCDSCPRVYHSKCLGLLTLPDGDWTCPECKITQCPSMMTDSSTSLKHHSTQEFHTMLKFALRRMKSHPQAGPFMQPVDSKQMPEYLDYIIHPMDLETIEKNVDTRKYTSTDAFLADVKWIVHNSVVFNGIQSKFTGIARAILKTARHEMTEIEICSECYLRSAQPILTDWFAEPCTVPHTLCWAKMKGYQPWPAKVLRIINDEVDVRFFGQHDRAWVSISNCLILSKEYPGTEKKRSNANFEKSLTELQTHIDRLKACYGQFNYAPTQTALSKTKPFKFIPTIDDSTLPSYIIAGGNNSTLRSSIKCVKQARSPLSQTMTESCISTKSATKRPNENSNGQEQTEPIKRARVLSRPADDVGPSSSRIVLRIRKTSDDVSSGRSEASTSSSSGHQITVHLKEPLVTVKEDDENESQTSLNDFDMLDQNEPRSVPEKIEDEPSAELLQNQPLPSSPPSPLPPMERCLDGSPKKRTPKASPKIHENEVDVRLTIIALLDAIDALKSISEVHHHIPLPSTSSIVSSISQPISTHIQYAERRSSTKHPRKPRLQHRVLIPQPKPILVSQIPPATFDYVSNDKSSSSNSTLPPSRQLSISPASTEIPEEIPSITNANVSANRRQSLEKAVIIESSSIKSEPVDTEGHGSVRSQAKPTAQPSPSVSSSISATKSFLISPPANPTHHKSKPSTTQHITPTATTSNNNTLTPRIPPTVAHKSNWPAALPAASAIRQPLSTTNKRPISSPIYPSTASRNSNAISSNTRMTSPTMSLPPQSSFDTFVMNPSQSRRSNGISFPSVTPPLSNRTPIRMPQISTHPVRPALEDHQTAGEIHTIIKIFNDKFQQLLSDFSTKIETALESNRLKYEKELEETRRSYRSSLNELRSFTTQQVQEMQNSLELQYWTRVAEMRNRYESTSQQQITKPSKQLNGGFR